MATNKSTKRSSASSATEAAPLPDLNLPFDPDFVTFPPLVSLDLMCKYISMFRTSFPQSLPTNEERLRAKVNVEFKL